MNNEKTTEEKYFNETTLNKSLYSNFPSAIKVAPIMYDNFKC